MAKEVRALLAAVCMLILLAGCLDWNIPCYPYMRRGSWEQPDLFAHLPTSEPMLKPSGSDLPFPHPNGQFPDAASVWEVVWRPPTYKNDGIEITLFPPDGNYGAGLSIRETGDLPASLLIPLIEEFLFRVSLGEAEEIRDDAATQVSRFLERCAGHETPACSWGSGPSTLRSLDSIDLPALAESLVPMGPVYERPSWGTTAFLDYSGGWQVLWKIGSRVLEVSHDGYETRIWVDAWGNVAASVKALDENVTLSQEKYEFEILWTLRGVGAEPGRGALNSEIYCSE